MEKGLSINGIKVVGDGLKGLEVNYMKEDDKDGKKWLNDYWQGRKVPIGQKLEDVIKSFRYYLLDVYGYDLGSSNEGDVNVTEINWGYGWFVIKGDKRVDVGDKVVKLKTPKVKEEDEYGKYAEVDKLLGQLKECVVDYMDGKSEMSNEQLVMRFYKDKGEYDEAKFAGMSEDEKEAEAVKILEKLGHIVILNSELEVGGSAAEGGSKVEGDKFVISDVKVVDSNDEKGVEVNVGTVPMFGEIGTSGPEDTIKEAPVAFKGEGTPVPMFEEAVQVNAETVTSNKSPKQVDTVEVMPTFGVQAEETKSFNSGIANAFKDLDDDESFNITPLKTA